MRISFIAFVLFQFGLIYVWSQNNDVIIKRLVNKAKSYQSTNPDSCEIFLDSLESLEFDEELNFYFGEFNQLKSHQYFMSQNLDSALYFQQKACNIFKDFPDSINHFISEYNKGNIFLALNEHIKALVQYKIVLRLIDENIEAYTINGEDNINLNKAYCYASIGMVYEFQGDHEENLIHLLKAYKIAANIKSQESKVLQAILLGNIGNAYCDLGEFQLAESYAISGMELKKALQLENTTGYNYQVLALAAYGRMKFDLSLKYLKISDELFKKTKNELELNRNSVIKSKCFLGQNKLNAALSLALDLMSKFNGPGVVQDKIELNELISEIYIAKNDFANANKFVVATSNLSKEYYSKTNLSAVDELVSYFEDEEKRIDERIDNYKILQSKKMLEFEIESKKEKDKWLYSFFIVLTICLILVILIIARGNRKNRMINKELNFSMDEKEILFKEVHHRVKNNFQIISSLLNLQQGVENDSRSKKVLMDAQGRIQSMSLVHEMLYRKNEVKSIDFYSYSKDLVDSIVKSLSKPGLKIQTNIQMVDVSFDLEIAVPLGLILNEAVTNSVKYAFPGKNEGIISICLEQLNPDEFRLEIKDNGIGIPAEILDGQKETLGIELIKILSEQLNGYTIFTIENGTIVTSIFTLN